MDDNLKTILYVFLIILLLSVVINIFKFKFPSGLGKAFQKVGVWIGDFGDSIISGCVKQDKCTDLTDSTTCNKGAGCIWAPDTLVTEDDAKNPVEQICALKDNTGNLKYKCSCYKKNSRYKESSGNWFSPTCALGFTALLTGIGLLTSFIVRLALVAFVSNKNVRIETAISGESLTNVIKEIYKETSAKFDALEEDLRTRGHDIEKLSDASAETIVTKIIDARVQKLLTTEELKSKYKNDVQSNTSKVLEEIAKRASEKDISEDEMKSIDESSERIISEDL